MKEHVFSKIALALAVVGFIGTIITGHYVETMLWFIIGLQDLQIMGLEEENDRY